MTGRRRLATLALCLLGLVLLAGAVVMPVAANTQPYSPYNPGEAGASYFASSLVGRSVFSPAFAFGEPDAVVASADLARRGLAAQAVVVVLEPTIPPSLEERAWLDRFVDGGGLLVVAGSTPATDAFLEGSGIRLIPTPVVDPRYFRQPAFLIADAEGLLGLPPGAKLALHAPGALRVEEGAQVLGRTTPHAFLDRDGDLARSPGEPVGTYAWAARATVGRGEVWAFSDADLFANGMRRFADDAIFLDAMIDALASRGRVVLDASHLAGAGEIGLSARLREVPTWARVGVPLILYAGVAAFLLTDRVGARAPAWLVRWLDGSTDGPSPGDLARAALQRHPEWDPVTLQEAAEGRPGPR